METKIEYEKRFTILEEKLDAHKKWVNILFGGL
jgi:hypothetical protein